MNKKAGISLLLIGLVLLVIGLISVWAYVSTKQEPLLDIEKLVFALIIGCGIIFIVAWLIDLYQR